jgi:hypothetical protein
MQQSSRDQQQRDQQSQQYHQQKVSALISNFRTQPSVDEQKRQRITNINNAGLNFALALEQNTEPGSEQSNAVERALEARQWGEDAVRSHQ